MYSTLTYFLSRSIIELPSSIIFLLIQCLIQYWLIGLVPSMGQFLRYYLIAYLMTLNGISLGFLIGSLVHDQKAVNLLTPIMVLPFFLFAGFYKNGKNLPVWVGWFQYLSPLKYCFSAWVQN